MEKKPDMSSKKILVIDDDPDVRMTLALRLESFGYVMVLAKNGADGYEKTKRWKPDLILLDFSMPMKPGIDVLKKLRAETSVKGIPVVMLTGREEFEKDCRDAGAADYITKPFDLFHLKEILSKFLQ